ncbi:MAG: OmpH family outer membrane protein [Phycisphaerales bacterium]
MASRLCARTLVLAAAGVGVGLGGLLVGGGAVASMLGLAPRASITAQAESSMAVVDTLAVVEAIVLSTPYQTARDARSKAAGDVISALQVQMQEIEQRAQNATPPITQGSPEYDAMAKDYNDKRAAANKEAQALEDFQTNQIKEAYALAVGAINTLAEDRGIAFVMTSRLDTTKFRSMDSNGVGQEVLARTVVRWPKALDLTDDVLKALNVTRAPEELPNAEPVYPPNSGLAPQPAPTTP